MITKEDLRKRLEQSLKTVQPGDLKAIEQKMFEHLTFMLQKYDDLTPDAQEMADSMMEITQKHIGEALQKLPDSKQKWVLKRLHAGSLGKRWLVVEMMKVLEAPPELKEDNSKEFRKIFVARLQNITDFLFDIYQNSLRGPAPFGQISLLGMCVDELLVILHLAQHYYINQAYSHVRTVVEHIDKIELFRIKPKWAEVWCGDDRERVRKELSPSQVRKKLGNPKYDPIYGWFSSLGPHGTFQAVQTKTFRKVELSSKGNPQIHQWFGGCPAEHNIVFLNAYALYTVHHVLLQLVRSFAQFLNDEEVKEVLKQSRNDTKEYLEHHFLPWVKNKNLDVTHLEDFLKSGPWGRME